MRKIYIHLTAAFAATFLGMFGALYLTPASAQSSPATKPFTMPASMPAVGEPKAIAVQREAIKGNAKAVASTVISVAKLESRKTDVGSRRDLFDGPTVTLNNMEGHISILNPGELSHPPHQHVNEEAIILMEGTLEVTINGKATMAEKGDVLFFSSLDWHNVHNIGTTPAMYYVLNWSTATKPAPTVQPAP